MARLGSRQTTQLATGVTVSYATQGNPDGPALILLHEWAGAIGAFDRLVPHLPPRLRVLAFDQRGHGDSDRPEHGYALRDFADDVVAFMDALDVATAVLLGASSGGYVAQQVALDHPERVSGLVLVGAPRSLHRRPPFADEVERLTDPIDEEWVRQSLDWMPLLHDVPEWYIDDRVRDGVQAPAHVWRESLEGLMTATPPTEAGRISVPGLVIWGERDELLHRADEERLARSLGPVPLVVYEGTGHLVLWEQPKRVAVDAARAILDLQRDLH
jgi:pimeloyl-ACP methyl ester carboxylesterase